MHPGHMATDMYSVLLIHPDRGRPTGFPVSAWMLHGRGTANPVAKRVARNAAG